MEKINKILSYLLPSLLFYTISANATTYYVSPSGNDSWYGNNYRNEKAGPGVYIYLITDTSGQKTTGRFIIIK